MKSSFSWITGSIILATALFLVSPTFQEASLPLNGWQVRELFIFMTGLAALILMVLITIIAARSAWVDRLTGGMDNAYRIHKWAAIAAFCLAVLHWGGENIPKYLVMGGLLAHPGDLSDGRIYSALETFLFNSGNVLIEYAFYVLVVLSIVALVGRIPYSIFRKAHKLMPFLFLVIAYHSSTAPLKDGWYGAVSGWVVLGLCILGAFYALVAVVGGIGRKQKHRSVIEHIRILDTGVVDLMLKSLAHPMQYKAGQFAFLRFAGDAELHPFTIASDVKSSGALRFVIKPLGDYTRTLAHTLVPGQGVEVEGPYGQFNFEDDRSRQIWLAGGIGVTPFMARLEYLAAQSGNRNGTKTDFWYCTRTRQDGAFPENLEHLCMEAGVTLHRMIAEEGQRLCADLVRKQLEGNLADVSVWVCGPASLTQCLRHDLLKAGLDRRAFHAENFAMR